MKNKIIVMTAIAAALVLPASTFASTYGYVSKTGAFETVTANSAVQALATSDIDAHSGVILLNAQGMTGTAMGAPTSVPMMVGTGTTMTSTSTSMMGTSTSMMTGTSTMMTTGTSSTMTTGSTTMSMSGSVSSASGTPAYFTSAHL